MDFSNKVALITGGANGIGLATAEQLAAGGAKIVIVDRDTAAGTAAAKALNARFIEADVTKSAEVQRYVRETLEAFKTIDLFFNNAGIEGQVVPIAEYDEDMFDRLMAVNVKGVFLGLRHVLPVMLRQGTGSIVNTASTAALVGSPGLGPYVGSKHAVLGLTRTAAGEVGGAGIRVNAVCPGPTDTRMIRSLEEQSNPDDPASSRTNYHKIIPLGRYATAEEVANVVVFLLSDLAASVTGAAYPVDGGRTASPAATWRQFAPR